MVDWSKAPDLVRVPGGGLRLQRQCLTIENGEHTVCNDDGSMDIYTAGRHRDFKLRHLPNAFNNRDGDDTKLGIEKWCRAARALADRLGHSLPTVFPPPARLCALDAPGVPYTSGWQMAAGSNRAAGDWTFMAGTVNVPGGCDPTGNPQLALWNGLQHGSISGQPILQPVLHWGVWAAPGTWQNWTVACYCVGFPGTSMTNAFNTSNGRTHRFSTSWGPGPTDWTVYIPGTGLTISATGKPIGTFDTAWGAVMETGLMNSCASWPSVDCYFSDIVATVSSNFTQPPTIGMTSANVAPQTCGDTITVLSDVNGSGQVKIVF